MGKKKEKNIEVKKYKIDEINIYGEGILKYKKRKIGFAIEQS